ncbi:hypothetical protein QYE76_017421 [Lolium multiflorum]|uniref:Uncharacterized protein n=1 Tax=Lolium multiflorum TaxID=4521 RepID=A0AAD8QIQ3_LOLMU|nr:hypothetical protein QYE76_017421 [Lolium multiflorum]
MAKDTIPSSSEVAEETPVTYGDLTGELKKKYDEIKSALEADLIGSFHRTRSHGIRWKGFTPEGALDGVDPSEERTRSLRQEINFMVAHSLHRHSESLVNTLERVALRVIQEIMSHQSTHTLPPVNMVEFTHLGGCQPDFSANISMVELGHRSEKDGDEDSCSQSKDTEGPLHAIGSVKMASATSERK